MSTFIKENQELSLKAICNLAIQICEILNYLHSYAMDDNTKCILHLDLKPDNIMICDDNSVKIIDYDNASYEEYKLKECIGSKGFAAPEQYHSLELGRSADIYSLGILFLYMSTSGYVQSFVEKIRHKDLKKIIKKCIHHNPYQRYDNVHKVIMDLQKISKKLIKEKSNKSLEINIVGLKHGIGTTHISLCLTNYLNKIGLKSLCIDCTESNHLLELVQNSKIHSNGTYNLHGSYLLPNYKNYISVELEGFEVIVRDLGIISEVDDNYFVENCNRYTILISGGKDYEQSELYKVLEQRKSCFCVLNHLSGKQFYSYIKNNRSNQKFYRMPCKYSWNSDELIENEVFSDLMNDIMPTMLNGNNKNNAIIRRCISNIFKKKNNEWGC